MKVLTQLLSEGLPSLSVQYSYVKFELYFCFNCSLFRKQFYANKLIHQGQIIKLSIALNPITELTSESWLLACQLDVFGKHPNIICVSALVTKIK